MQSNLAGSLTVKGCDINQGDEDPGAACEAARGGGVALSKVFTGGNGDFPGAFTKFDGSSPASATRLNDPLPLRAPNPAIAGVQLVPAATHDNVSVTILEPWESATLGPNPTVNGIAQNATTTKNRGELGDGENIFYTKPIRITNVPGLNGPDDGANAGKVIQGTCTTCHSNPDVGNHSRARFFNIGIADPNPGNVGLFNMADFPQYTFRNSTGSRQVTFTDPGLALRTGKFADLGKFKVPQLRGLANRAPYFHNGAAKSLTDVVNFYNRRFNIGFTADEIRKVCSSSSRPDRVTLTSLDRAVGNVASPPSAARAPRTARSSPSFGCGQPAGDAGGTSPAIATPCSFRRARATIQRATSTVKLKNGSTSATTQSAPFVRPQSRLPNCHVSGTSVRDNHISGNSGAYSIPAPKK